jgi:hypothetical protein
MDHNLKSQDNLSGALTEQRQSMMLTANWLSTLIIGHSVNPAMPGPASPQLKRSRKRLKTKDGGGERIHVWLAIFLQFLKEALWKQNNWTNHPTLMWLLFCTNVIRLAKHLFAYKNMHATLKEIFENAPTYLHITQSIPRETDLTLTGYDQSIARFRPQLKLERLQ